MYWWAHNVSGRQRQLQKILICWHFDTLEQHIRFIYRISVLHRTVPENLSDSQSIQRYIHLILLEINRNRISRSTNTARNRRRARNTSACNAVIETRWIIAYFKFRYQSEYNTSMRDVLQRPSSLSRHLQTRNCVCVCVCVCVCATYGRWTLLAAVSTFLQNRLRQTWLVRTLRSRVYSTLWS